MSYRLVRLSDIAVEDRAIVAPDSRAAATRPYLGLEQIESGSGRITAYEGNPAEGKSTTFAFDDRHVLYGKLRPYLNKVALPERAGRCSTEIIPLLPIGVDRSLLAFLLRTNRVIARAMSEKTGSRMPRADMDAVLNIRLSIPASVDDQCRLAARLRAQIAEVESARLAVQTQKQDAPALRHSLRRTAFGLLLDRYDREWCLKDVCSISAGGTPSRGRAAYFKGNVPWVKTLDLDFGIVTDTDERISQEAFLAIRGELLPVGTVLVAMYGGAGTIGKSGILGIEACTNQAVCALQPKASELDSAFLHEWLCYIRPEWMRLSGGSRKDPNINKSIVENMTVPLPPLDEQRVFATRLIAQLAEADAIAQAAAAQLAEIERLPQRLLAQALEN